MFGWVWEPAQVDFRRVRSIRESIESGELRFGVRLCSRPMMVWRLVRLGPCGRCACHAGCTRLGREGPGCDGRLSASRKPERRPAEPLCGCCERRRGMWIASLWPSPNCNQPSGDPPHSGSPQWAAACVQSSAKALTRVRRTRGRRLKRVRSGGLGSRRVSPRSPYGRNGAARGWLSSAVVTNSGPVASAIEPCARPRVGRMSDSYLVDPASSHMLVSKIKPCMSKYKQLYTVKLRMAH